MDDQLVQLALNRITSFYLESHEFNGIPVAELATSLGIAQEEVAEVLRSLIREGSVRLVFGDTHPNPHIRAFPDEPSEVMLQKLDSCLMVHTCAYPTARHLERVVSPEDYAGKPYELELALGEAQLAFRAFDLSVLEDYRNDPRYWYTNDDIRGSISVRDEYYQSERMAEKAKVVLQSFGFCYDDHLNRAVGVFVRYLAGLSAEHQQVWKAKELAGEYNLHPDYYRNSILGAWGTRLSVFDAFIEELKVVNRMCELMKRPHLFRRTFEENRPKHFGFLVRPTLAEFDEFVQTLDKMMSENIDKKFFQGDVPDEVEEERPDGKVNVRPKGTITMLADWLGMKFRPSDPDPLNEMLATFREVRDKRSGPAHVIKTDEFNQGYFHKQRAVMIRASGALRTLRLILANHPLVRSANLEIDELLLSGQIWTY